MSIFDTNCHFETTVEPIKIMTVFRGKFKMHSLKSHNRGLSFVFMYFSDVNSMFYLVIYY